MSNILFAEDEEAIRKTVKYHLEKQGYQVIIARNGKEAVRLFETNRSEISMVILDALMPIMDGFQVCREIRKQDQSLPVFMITAIFTTSDYPEEAKKSGINEFFTKPVDYHFLLKKIKEYLHDRETPAA